VGAQAQKPRNLASFTGADYDKGRSRVIQALWFACMNLVFSAWWCPGRIRPLLLRAFGADIGANVFIRHRVRVLWPWKLTIGDNCWLGEDSWFLSLETITLGDDVCVSQGAFICTGSHDRRDPAFEYDNAPIVIQRGSWIGAHASILRGVTVGEEAVIGARAVVARDVPSHSLVVSGTAA
jgi:putative colanic acid biosynthesis acetyltransferase WcaF